MTRPALRADVEAWAPQVIAAPEALVGRRQWRHFFADESGASMVEYGMMIALIAIMVMGALYLLGGSLTTKLTQAATCLTTRVCS